MRKTKQETREEKISRWIRNVTRGLEQAPTLKCLRKCKTELEAQLLNMSLEERRALVPWEETERDRQESIATLTELIAADEKKLESMGKEIKERIAELRQCRAKLQRQGPYC